MKFVMKFNKNNILYSNNPLTIFNDFKKQKFADLLQYKQFPENKTIAIKRR